MRCFRRQFDASSLLSHCAGLRVQPGGPEHKRMLKSDEVERLRWTAFFRFATRSLGLIATSRVYLGPSYATGQCDHVPFADFCATAWP